jgi:hypothetical protein
MSSARLPAIPTPDAENLLVSVQALKQAVEILSGQVGGTGPGSVPFELVAKAAASGATPTTSGGGGGGGLGGLITDINSLTTLINTLIGQARREFNNAIAIAQQAASEAVADLNVAFGELNDLIASQGVTIVSLQSQTGDNAAGITDEIAARATADEALSGRITTLKATVDDNTAAIVTEQVTRATADTAISGQLTTLTATVAGNSAAISAEAVTRATEDSALSATLTNVSAVASKQRVFSQSSPPSSTGRTVGDIWIDTANGNLIKYWDGSQWLVRDDTRIAVNAANISNEVIARATADDALTTQITALTSTVSGNTAAINNEAVTRATQDTALAGQISSLTAQVSNNAAALTNEAFVRASADSALSAQITSVEAQSNAGTANGKMQIAAVSINNGVVATEFSVNVSATGANGSYANTGLRMQAMSNGASRVLFNADSFLIASGNSTHVPFAIVDTSLVPQFNVGPGQIKLGDSSNCLLNGAFDNASLSGWVPAATTRISVAGADDPGGQNRLVSQDRDAAYSNIVTARASQEFYLSAMVWNAAPERANLYLVSSDAAGNNKQYFVAAYTDLKTQWVLLEGVCKLPADTKVQQVQVLLQTNSTGARPVGQETYWGKVSLRRAITSSMLTAGVGANVVYNSTFNSGSTGWVSGYNGTGLSSGFGRDLYPYILNGGHTLYATLSGVQPTNSIFDCYSYVVDNSVQRLYPVRGGDRVQFYTYFNLHRCIGKIGIVFFAGATSLEGQPGGIVYSNEVVAPGAPPPNGFSLNTYKIAKVICDVPASADTAFLFFRMLGTGESDPYMFWTRPFFGPAGPAQTDVSPWSTGIEPQFGPANLITSSNISTYIANAAIDLARINVASINYLSAFSANIGEVTAGVVRSADNKVRFDLSNSYMLISD